MLSLLSGPSLTSVHDYWENNSYIKFKGPSVKLPKPQLACILGLSLSPVLSSFSSGPVYSFLLMPMCETGVLCVHQGSSHHLSSISRGSKAFPNFNSALHSPHLSFRCRRQPPSTAQSCQSKSWFYTCSLTCALLHGFSMSPKPGTLRGSYVKPYFLVLALKFPGPHQTLCVFLQGHPNVVTLR